MNIKLKNLPFNSNFSSINLMQSSLVSLDCVQTPLMKLCHCSVCCLTDITVCLTLIFWPILRLQQHTQDALCTEDQRPRRSAPLCFADRAEQFPQLPLLFLCFKWTQSTRCTHPTHATTSEMWWETQQQSILGHHGELWYSLTSFYC